MTLFAAVVETSARAGETRSRLAKVSALSELLKTLDPGEVAPVVGFLTGEARQGRVGIGWAMASEASRTDLSTRSGGRPLEVRDLDEAITHIQATTGEGSQERRTAILAGLFARTTAAEEHFLRRFLVGELRQGALAGLMTDAVAKASGVTVDAVRRAAMLSGDLGTTALAALHGGTEVVAQIGLAVGRAVFPMLAGAAASVDDALGHTGPASIEWKLDGARVQVHRAGDEVRVFTRNLNDISERLPGLAETLRAFACTAVILDGESLGFFEEDAPQRFQDTISALSRQDGSHTDHLRTYFFDILHVDGTDLIDEPLSVRRTMLERVTGQLAVPALQTDDPGLAARFLEDALAAGHEGVVVKALTSRYEAGRRGGAWRKVKPVRTLDLVVIGAEWGHGRRTGWLSNLHLGARNRDDGSFMMVGKTFKGLTDRLLAWQTSALQARATHEAGITVHVRPELVVEIALDGVQASTRYPGGVALRFARVKRYREDKDPADADTIDSVRAML